MQQGCPCPRTSPAHTAWRKGLCASSDIITGIWWNGMGIRRNAVQLLCQGISAIPVGIPMPSCLPVSVVFPAFPAHCTAVLFYPVRICRGALCPLRYYHIHTLPLAVPFPAAKRALARGAGRQVCPGSPIYRCYGCPTSESVLSGVPVFLSGISPRHRSGDAAPETAASGQHHMMREWNTCHSPAML